MSKPRIIIHSKDDEEGDLGWSSDGWYDVKSRLGNPEKADALFAKARACIEAGKDVRDVVRLLEKAGFAVVREPMSAAALAPRLKERKKLHKSLGLSDPDSDKH